ncbi:hypothetical protein E2K98_29125 [Bacillus salipaludis]|uniref:Tyr recombinase domain-containing protein n=1 Tax=Bacillus salipaludis TaxID=2547811 RepID=A0A4R5VHS0_9BACI|nr:hypothetical protein E2K98_29125 [Bacillus salipaludis]
MVEKCSLILGELDFMKLQSCLKLRNLFVHILRHTGALLYITNGGEPFSLQKILGHTDMSLTRKYVNMTNMDVKRQHNSFSPLRNVFR